MIQRRYIINDFVSVVWAQWIKKFCFRLKQISKRRLRTFYL